MTAHDFIQFLIYKSLMEQAIQRPSDSTYRKAAFLINIALFWF